MTNPSGRARVPGSEPSERRGGGRAPALGVDKPPAGRLPAGRSGGDRPGTARPVSGRAKVGASRPVSPAGPGGRPPVDGGPGGRSYRGRPQPKWGRIALVAGVALALLIGLGGFGIYLYAHNLDSKIGRTDPFSQITGGRPPVIAKGAMNMLLLGSDSRDPDEKANPGSRTDTIILMHMQADHKHAYLISIPRDTYVSIPGHGKDKINAAFAFGGLPLVIRTVETFTGVHIDHLALIDFGGFQEVTDALGGVDMTVDQTIKSIHPPYRTFTKGTHHYTGAEALDYVRQRYQFADGDITREKHQQAFLKDIMDKAASTGTLTNPGKLNGFLQSLTKAMTVDKQFSLVDMAWQFHGLRSSNLTFMTSPWTGFGNEDGESVVIADKPKALALYDAVAKDTVSQYLASPQAKATPGN